MAEHFELQRKEGTVRIEIEVDGAVRIQGTRMQLPQ